MTPAEPCAASRIAAEARSKPRPEIAAPRPAAIGANRGIGKWMGASRSTLPLRLAEAKADLWADSIELPKVR